MKLNFRCFPPLLLAFGVLAAAEPKLAGALFRYAPLEGRSADHAKAYRRHLAWHRAAGDPLDWYAWQVDSGPRRGDFVDGTLDLGWADFDARVRPAEDAADFNATAGPLARAVDTLYLERMPEASRWEGRLLSPRLLVLEVEVAPGREQTFEAFLAKATKGDPTPRIGYRVVSGAALPKYLLLLPAQGMGGLPEGPRWWKALAIRSRGGLRSWIRSVSSETRSLLPDLCLFPGLPSRSE